ncbi:MAG: hypothetical protein EOM26_12395 [Alphaproteobacteria bacterium]|jgi:hypothetical protein|nr:hypothetical protein [Alphaproteobacteria bacterium]
MRNPIQDDAWPVREAVIRLLGGDVDETEGVISSVGMRPLRRGEPDPIREICQQAYRALDAGALPFVGKRKHALVSPAAFVEWASGKGYMIPDTLEPLRPARVCSHHQDEGAHVEPATEGNALQTEEPERGSALEQREKALVHWLESKTIPRREWPRLKSIHGMSRKTMYEELKGYPAFKSRHSDEPVSLSTFIREFWNEQGIASLD